MPKTSKPRGVTIRRAKSSDAARLAVLSGELGYPATPGEMKSRLSRLKPTGDNAVFVAENHKREVIGWLHVSVAHLLELPLRAEVNGLIVSGGQRSRGAGAGLLQ